MGIRYLLLVLLKFFMFPPVFPQTNMWSRKQSVCSAVSGTSKCDDSDSPLAGGVKIYPFAIALRVRVLQIVCGIGGLVVGAVGWLEERKEPELGLGVPAGAITVLAAAISVYYSRGFGGWTSSRSSTTRHWGAPWRALGPSPCAAVPLTLLWTAAIGAHVAMLAFCFRSLLNIGNFTGCLTLHGETQQCKHCCFTAGLASKMVVAIQADLAQANRAGAAADSAECLKRRKYVVGPCVRSARIATTILLANPAVKQQCLRFCVSAWRVRQPVKLLALLDGFAPVVVFPDKYNLGLFMARVNRLLLNQCGSTTCVGVAGAQLSFSITTLAAAVFMVQLDLRYDASLSPPPRQSDMHTCTAVSMVPLTSVAINSGNSGDATDPGGSPQEKIKEPQSPPEPPT
ncbi:hypothetical protein MSG28_007949 [Choristoneura fumiferana]|uniref:Uncharacterized protein n=1 Tax=Choristoneura fumiferana TaxID=7141 RepID=A0ACC0J9C3_CHOFU|nr:hypothetical protein MSG28_007949 [Choristoneura fumiferana]